MPAATVLANVSSRVSAGLYANLHDDAGIGVEEGREEEQRARRVGIRRRRGRGHGRDDDARRRSLNGRHAERIERLDVGVRDRVGSSGGARFDRLDAIIVCSGGLGINHFRPRDALAFADAATLTSRSPLLACHSSGLRLVSLQASSLAAYVTRTVHLAGRRQKTSTVLSL